MYAFIIMTGGKTLTLAFLGHRALTSARARVHGPNRPQRAACDSAPDGTGAPPGPEWQPGRLLGAGGARSWGRGSGGGRRRRCPFLTGVSLSLSLGTAAARPKPREAVAPQRRPAPRSPGEPLPVGGRHHAPGRRQLPREAPRGRRPGAPARRPRPPQARAPVSQRRRRPRAQLRYLRRLAASRPPGPPPPPPAPRPRSQTHPRPDRPGAPRSGARSPGSTCALGRRGSRTSSSRLPTPGSENPAPGAALLPLLPVIYRLLAVLPVSSSKPRPRSSPRHRRPCPEPDGGFHGAHTPGPRRSAPSAAVDASLRLALNSCWEPPLQRPFPAPSQPRLPPAPARCPRGVHCAGVAEACCPPVPPRLSAARSPGRPFALR